MSMSSYRADASLTAALKGAATPYVMLHIGAPGADGTGNEAQLSASDIVRKAVSFGDIGNHSTNMERRVLNSTLIAWTGAEIDAAQEITHFSIWDDETDGDVEFIAAISVPKTTGSDGVSIAIGTLEVAVQVFAKPA